MKDIEEFKGSYAITEDGKIWSYKKKKYLATFKLDYEMVNLDGKLRAVHRLLAQAYIPNPNNLPIVNHKDENKFNNSLDNLEWCDHSYNRAWSQGKQVECIETGEIFQTVTAAAKAYGVSASTISNNCHGINKDIKKLPGLHFSFTGKKSYRGDS